jgi:hypothetical protein
VRFDVRLDVRQSRFPAGVEVRFAGVQVEGFVPAVKEKNSFIFLFEKISFFYF